MPSVKNYLSLIKFSHTIFALPFALIGFTLGVAEVGFTINKLLLVLLCMVFARSAAMSFNRYIDSAIDGANPRTATVREIPNGTINRTAVFRFMLGNCSLFIFTTWFINPICWALSPVALAIILGYSYTKRFTALCHLFLGLGLSLAPIGAYLALTAEFALIPLLFSAAVLLWVAGFDIIYALGDETFDRNQQLHSVPVLLGKKNALHLSIFLHVGTIIFLLISGIKLQSLIYPNLYWIGLSLFTTLLIYQHSLVKPNDLSQINLAFFTTNGIASIIFGTFVILDILI